MSKPSRQQAEETFALKLAAKERQFLLKDLDGVEPGTVSRLKQTPAAQSFQLTFDQLEELAWHVTNLLPTISPEERTLLSAVFKRISEAMRTAAAQEEESEDLKRVLAVKKERERRKK